MKLGIDVNRHKEIIVKAISALLLLLLKHLKLNHIYQVKHTHTHTRADFLCAAWSHNTYFSTLFSFSASVQTHTHTFWLDWYHCTSPWETPSIFHLIFWLSVPTLPPVPPHFSFFYSTPIPEPPTCTTPTFPSQHLFLLFYTVHLSIDKKPNICWKSKTKSRVFLHFPFDSRF